MSNTFTPKRFSFDASLCESALKGEAINSSRFASVFYFLNDGFQWFQEIHTTKSNGFLSRILIKDYSSLQALSKNVRKTCINSKHITDIKHSIFFDSDVQLNSSAPVLSLTPGKMYLVSHDGCEHKTEISNRIYSSKVECMHLTHIQSEKCSACRFREGSVVAIDSPVLLRMTCILCHECFGVLTKHSLNKFDFIEINSLI